MDTHIETCTRNIMFMFIVMRLQKHIQTNVWGDINMYINIHINIHRHGHAHVNVHYIYTYAHAYILRNTSTDMQYTCV